MSFYTFSSAERSRVREEANIEVLIQTIHYGPRLPQTDTYGVLTSDGKYYFRHMAVAW